MTVYNLFIFDRLGNCRFYKEWQRPLPAKNQEEENKLLYGLLFQLKVVVDKIMPEEYVRARARKRARRAADGCCMLRRRSGGDFHYVRTAAYTLNFFLTGSGLRFVLNTSADTPVVRSDLQRMFAEVYVPHVARNVRV